MNNYFKNLFLVIEEKISKMDGLMEIDNTESPFVEINSEIRTAFIVVEEKFTMIVNLKREKENFLETTGWLDIHELTEHKLVGILNDGSSYSRFENKEQLEKMIEKAFEEAKVKRIFNSFDLFFLPYLLKKVEKESMVLGFDFNKEKVIGLLMNCFGKGTLSELELEMRNCEVYVGLVGEIYKIKIKNILENKIIILSKENIG